MARTVATVADFWRLAEEAERRSIRILVEPISGEHFATSATHPTILYWVTGFSCTCKGFTWQRCTHHSLLLKHLGWLLEINSEPDPNPDPSPASPGLPSPALPCRPQSMTGGAMPSRCQFGALSALDIGWSIVYSLQNHDPPWRRMCTP